jgi:hypothetical protein
VHDRVGLANQGSDYRGIGHITDHEFHPVLGQADEGDRIRGIRESIQDRDRVRGRGEHVADQVGSDESCAAGDQQVTGT